MTPAVLTATFAPPPFSRREALRYAGCDADAGAALEALLDAAVKETWDKLTYRVCYARLLSRCAATCATSARLHAPRQGFRRTFPAAMR